MEKERPRQQLGRPRRAASWFALVPAALTLAGCVPGTAVSSRALDYNVAAEKARGEMLLLNVLRARDRKPMVFTGLARITGSVKSQAEIGANLVTSAPAAEVYGISPSFGMTDSPTFDVAVLDSQEFTRGIMTPLAFDVVEYLWDQGFNREVLLYLVVKRMELDCTGQGGEPTVLENDPTDPTFGAFQALLYAIVDGGRWEVDELGAERIGPPIDAAEARRPGTLLQVASSHLSLRPLPDGTFQLERPAASKRLVVPADAPCGERKTPGLRLYDSKPPLELARLRAPGAPRGRLVLRSPQSILFYLGELIRPGRGVLLRPHHHDRSPEALFTVVPGGACPSVYVSARYEGERNAVPEGDGPCDPGRSLQALAMAGQLLSLQQSAKDLPVTSTVRIVGQ